MHHLAMTYTHKTCPRIRANPLGLLAVLDLNTDSIARTGKRRRTVSALGAGRSGRRRGMGDGGPHIKERLGAQERDTGLVTRGKRGTQRSV